MKNKQTAVEWLEEKLIVSGFLIPKSFVQQAKQMEKEQIIKANLDGFCEAYDVHAEDVKSTEDYYNETYGELNQLPENEKDKQSN